MTSRLCTAAAAIGLLVGLTAMAAADDVDDYVAQMRLIEDERGSGKRVELSEGDKILAKRFPERVYRSFTGVYNHVNFKKLGDKHWVVPGRPYGTERTFDRRGPQIRGHWSTRKDGIPEDQVSCVIVSFEHGTPVEFEALERKVDPTDQKALLGAYHEIAMKTLAPVPEPAEGEDPKKPSKERKLALADRKQCKPAKKKRVGKMFKWFASTQGVVTESAARERREWYSWSSKQRKATYVLFVRVHASGLGSRKVVSRGETFAKAVSDGG